VLLDRYAGVLLDGYGVLVDGARALPGSAELLAELARRGTPFAIVTNDASRSPATCAERYAVLGLQVPAERFVTSGSLLAGYFADRGLIGARTCVLGTADSEAYVRAAGGEIVPLVEGLELDVLAVCDDAGFDFLPTIEWALSAAIRAVESGRKPALVLPNPDLIYPKGSDELGFTAGAIALLLEAGLGRRCPSARLAFDPLGKPEPHLFHAAASRLGLPIEDLLMIGDQLETDIAGAHAVGCDAALIAGASGVSRWHVGAPITPTYLLDRLWS
jgi:ribonucleotide monophosphatase NagD (HAD superfamily)